MSTLSGIKKVEYDAAGNSFAAAVDLGAPLEENATVTNEVTTVPDASGIQLYAGTPKEVVFQFPDQSTFAALETKMKADDKIDVRITHLDDTTTTIAQNASVQVRKVYGTSVGGVNSFEMKLQVFEV